VGRGDALGAGIDGRAAARTSTRTSCSAISTRSGALLVDLRDGGVGLGGAVAEGVRVDEPDAPVGERVGRELVARRRYATGLMMMERDVWLP
jgi:hypothetical protein